MFSAAVTGYTLPKSYRAGAADCAELIPNKDSPWCLIPSEGVAWMSSLGNVGNYCVGLSTWLQVVPLPVHAAKTPCDSVSKAFPQEKTIYIYISNISLIFLITMSYYNHLIVFC